MKKPLRLAAAGFTAFALCLAAFAAGCADAMRLLDPAPEPEPDPVLSTEVYVPTERVRSWNPVVSKDEDTYFFSKILYEGLFALGADLAAEPLLAASSAYSEDGTVLSVSLQPGVRFHDGTPLTAEDVKFSIEAYQSAAAAGLGLYASYVDGIRSVKVTGPLTVAIQFRDPSDASLESLVFPIVSGEAYRRPADLVRDVDPFRPNGTGPYRWEETAEDSPEGQTVRLVGFEGYRGEIPGNTLVVTVVPGKEEAVNLFETGEIHMTLLRSPDRDTLLGNREIHVVSFPSNEAEVLGFNQASEALLDPAVRRAIAAAIDTEALIESCYYGNGVLNDSLFFPGYLGRESGTDAYPYDPEEARSILADTSREIPALTLLVETDDPSRLLAGRLIQADLQRAGLTVALAESDAATYADRLLKGDYDIYLGGFRFGETYDLRPILGDGPLNHTGYRNASLDLFLGMMQSGLARDEKASLLRSAQEILDQELPYYCLLYKTYGLAVPSAFEGKAEPTFFDIYGSCSTWRIRTGAGIS